jgi:hypothetical protein
MNTQIKFDDDRGIWIEETERDENEKLVYIPTEENNEFLMITPINIIIQTG